MREIDCQVADVLDALYQASQDNTLWPEFLAAGVRLFDARLAGLIVQSTVTGRCSFAASIGAPTSATQLYDDRDHNVDLWFLGMRDRGIVEWIGPGSALCPPAQSDESEFHRDSCTAEVPAFYQSGILQLNSGISSVFTLHRDASQPGFGEKETRLLRDLAPHLRRALALHDKILELQGSLTAAGTRGCGRIGVDAVNEIPGRTAGASRENADPTRSGNRRAAAATREGLRCIERLSGCWWPG